VCLRHQALKRPCKRGFGVETRNCYRHQSIDSSQACELNDRLRARQSKLFINDCPPENGNLAACPLKLGGGFADRR
jgi:hypothetical protein